MSATISVRVAETLRRELEARSAAEGKSLSQIVREILQRAIDGKSVGERTAHLKGSLSLPRRRAESWRHALRQRNWRS